MSEEIKPLPWRNYKQWIFDANNDHVFDPDLNISENEAKAIVAAFNDRHRLTEQNNEHYG